LPKETASRFALELALALAWNRRSEALHYFALVDAKDIDERAAEWYARAAIWADDWKRTKKIIAAMPDTLRNQTRWRYWLARAAEQLGERGAAQRQYTELLGDDNYYAALAAARLGQLRRMARWLHQVGG
jgi:soluble lytic murein transglycosylase